MDDVKKLMEKFHLRHSTFFPYDIASGITITVIGAGAIGSWTCLALARYGINLRIIDFDKVEIHNLANQFYGKRHLGMPKVEALAQQLEEYTLANIEPINAYFGGLDKDEDLERLPDNVSVIHGPLRGIVIPAMDSMTARNIVYRTALKAKFSWQAIVDPRMGLLSAQIVVTTPATIDEYIGSPLDYSDNKSNEAPCTARVCPTTAMLIGTATADKVIAMLRNKYMLTDKPKLPIVPHTELFFQPISTNHTDYNRNPIVAMGSVDKEPFYAIEKEDEKVERKALLIK